MREVIGLELILDNQIYAEQSDETLYRMLDRGIDDMEAERELPLDEAFDKITELRNIRRNARAIQEFRSNRERVWQNLAPLSELSGL